MNSTEKYPALFDQGKRSLFLPRDLRGGRRAFALNRRGLVILAGLHRALEHRNLAIGHGIKHHIRISLTALHPINRHSSPPIDRHSTVQDYFISGFGPFTFIARFGHHLAAIFDVFARLLADHDFRAGVAVGDDFNLGDDFGDDFFVFVALLPPLPPPRRVNVFLNRKDFFFVV